MFHKQYPTSEKPEEFEKDGVTLFRPPGGKTYQEYIMPAVPSTENSYNRVFAIYGDNPPPFDEGDGIIGGRVIKNSGMESILSDLQAQLQVMGQSQYYQDFYDEVVSPNMDSPKFKTLTAEDILKEYENWVAETKDKFTESIVWQFNENEKQEVLNKPYIPLFARDEEEDNYPFQNIYRKIKAFLL